MPLGLMSGVSYEEGRNLLREGHGILFYSDGLVEAHNPNREMFGSPRLHQLILEYDEGSSLGDVLLEELYTPSPGRVGSMVGSAGFLPVRSDVRNNFRKLAYNSC